MFGNLKNLYWYVETAGNNGKPLSPGLELPQAIGFDETHGGIEKGQRGEKTKPARTSAAGGLDEDARIVMRGIQVRLTHQLFGRRLQIVMDEMQQAQAGGKHDQSFQRLEDGDEVYALNLMTARLRRRKFVDGKIQRLRDTSGACNSNR